ncbi:ABC-type dipeptide/oligopeptide/nickel transport system permease component [Bradyrhizobium sp. LM2.7]
MNTRSRRRQASGAFPFSADKDVGQSHTQGKWRECSLSTLRRAVQAIGVMFAVGIIAFSMFRFAGDPVNQIVSIDTSAAEREAVRKALGLDDPVPVQFVRYFADAAQFKFGVSYQFRQPVSTLLMERMPATLELAICATVLAMVLGILMGVYSALKRVTVLAKLFQAVSLIGISLPTFLIGRTNTPIGKPLSEQRHTKHRT